MASSIRELKCLLESPQVSTELRIVLEAPQVVSGDAVPALNRDPAPSYVHIGSAIATTIELGMQGLAIYRARTAAQSMKFTHV